MDASTLGSSAILAPRDDSPIEHCAMSTGNSSGSISKDLQPSADPAASVNRSGDLSGIPHEQRGARERLEVGAARQEPGPTLLRVMGCVEELLRTAVEQARAQWGAGAEHDAFRGLYVSDRDLGLALQPKLDFAAASGRAEARSRLSRACAELAPLETVAQRLELDEIDTAILLVALAVEVDSRLERVFAYLHDDVSRRRPSVGLVLDLLLDGAEARLHERRRFAPEAPLLRHAVLRLVGEQATPLSTQALCPDPGVLSFLLGEPGLYPPVAEFCTLLMANRSTVPPIVSDPLRLFMAALERWEGGPCVVHLRGARATDAYQAAEHAAISRRRPLLVAALDRLSGSPADQERALRALFRESRLRESVLLFEQVDLLMSSDRVGLWRWICRRVGEHDGPVLFAGCADVSEQLTGLLPRPVPFEVVRFGALPPTAARPEWEAGLRDAGIAPSATLLDDLSHRFRLTPAEIRQAIADVVGPPGEINGGEQTRLAPASHHTPASPDFSAAVRRFSSPDLGGLATHVDADVSWDDLVLPADPLRQLHEIHDHVCHLPEVLDRWGMAGGARRRRGVTALFVGPSGTGKTMAAAIVSRALCRDLYRVEISQLVSKYIGDTEKHIDDVMRRTRSMNAVLMFDEADALFGKRTDLRDAHDRYANIETAYLLQKIEQHDGITILATNLQNNMDDAFIRRLDFTVEFPFPDESHRLAIWELHMPERSRWGSDVDLPFFARQFPIPGGSIRNIVVAAAIMGAAGQGVIGMRELVLATRREMQKIGKTCTKADFAPHDSWVREFVK